MKCTPQRHHGLVLIVLELPVWQAQCRHLGKFTFSEENDVKNAVDKNQNLDLA